MENKLSLFTSNVQAMEKEFRLHEDIAKRMVALLYALENKEVDCESIHQCLKLAKKNVGFFSPFRGSVALCISALFALSPDPQGLFDKTLKVYDLLRDAKLRDSDFLAMAAYAIASLADSADYPNAVNRTQAFFDGIKAHRSLTAETSDYIFVAMLGLSELDVTTGIDCIERFYSQLKDKFSSEKGVQRLSQVLVLGGSDDKAVEHVLALRDAFEAQGISLDKPVTLPILGVLSLLPTEPNMIVQDISEAQKSLQTQKGLGSQELLISVATVVAHQRAKSTEKDIVTATRPTSLTNIMMAQQAALITMMTNTSWLVWASPRLD